MSEQVRCDYCGNFAKMVLGDALYPHRPDLQSKNFWVCWKCRAWVGCHPANTSRNPHKPNGMGDGTVPLGRLANAELRKAKNLAHQYFDVLWKDKHFTRRGAYHWLSTMMGLEFSQTHIGNFSVEQCYVVARLSKEKLDTIPNAPKMAWPEYIRNPEHMHETAQNLLFAGKLSPT